VLRQVGFRRQGDQGLAHDAVAPAENGPGRASGVSLLGFGEQLVGQIEEGDCFAHVSLLCVGDAIV
jgi:hypothetical protein